MFLLEPGHTQYDLHFRIAGTPVRVHPMFWLFNAILGFSALNDENGIAKFGIWMGSAFFSILLHEMGHILMGRAFGNEGHVVLYAFGGLAMHYRQFRHRWKRILVLFAGPGIQLVLVALMLVGLACMGSERLEAGFNLILALLGIPHDRFIFFGLHPLVEQAIFDLFVINVFWALLNLLPIWPLDGGQISKESLDGLMPGGRGRRMAYGISLVLAGVLAVHIIASANGHRLIPFLPGFGSSGYTAILFAMLAVQSYQMLQEESKRPWREDW